LAEEVKSPSGTVWGVIENDTYITRRRPSHRCRRYKGWGIQATVFQTLLDSHVRRIVIELPTGYLISDIEDWQKHGVRATLNPSFGEQIFLGEKHFTRSGILVVSR